MHRRLNRLALKPDQRTSRAAMSATARPCAGSARAPPPI
jgi:hypothetical protein